MKQFLRIKLLYLRNAMRILRKWQVMSRFASKLHNYTLFTFRAGAAGLIVGHPFDTTKVSLSPVDMKDDT